MLHRELVTGVNQPFRFLDLACGDARLTVAALQGTPVIHYHGIDLSAPALAMARQTVKSLACPAESSRRISSPRCEIARSRRTLCGSAWLYTTFRPLISES